MPASILISDLASLLNTDEFGVRSLIPHYLTLCDTTHVTLPPLAALEWLKPMFLPLPARPLFKVNEILLLAELSLPLLRQICLAYSIPIHRDPALGELFSPESFIRLLDALHGFREPGRFDRAMLMEWMRASAPNLRLRSHLPYSKLVEGEIDRIAKLEEPERTIQATAFWERYRAAKKVSDCLGKKNREAARLGRQLRKLVKASIGTIGREPALGNANAASADASSSPSHSSVSNSSDPGGAPCLEDTTVTPRGIA